MTPNPALGVLFHWLGGLAAGSFYVPYRGVKNWSWETYWLVGGVFSWIIAPCLLALLLTRDLSGVLARAPVSTILWCVLFGLLWGVGGLTFGLTVRYLGLSLGIAIVMGLCAAFGTLMPPIVNGTFVSQVWEKTAGRVTLLGIGLCLVGIAIAGLAGVYKERTISDEVPQSVIKEFDLKKGFLVALVSGLMSSCFAYGLAAGAPIKVLAVRAGTPPLWQGLPVLIVVLIGGFITNFVWSVYLNIRNKTASEYLGGNRPLIRNYLLCALAGTTWYFQFLFYSMGETKMGAYSFSSWTLHMASIVIFSTLWGIGLKEWKGSGRMAARLLALGLVVLIGSTVVVGYGNYLNAAVAK
jgi:L-rhamnose-H+ transport protein